MTQNNAGSMWLRWEPHIHVPGTIFNDQFGGEDALENYLQRIESSSPPIRALGVTDYYVTDSYEKILEAKANGRLPNCGLIFPNIELRLSVGTMKKHWVNIHLLVDPTDPKHLEELERFLGQLQFVMPGDTYRCTKSDLRRLGQKQKPELTTEAQQIEEGAKQFKVDVDSLKSVYDNNAWAKTNILIAVAGGDDGIGGVRDAADNALRQKIASFAHVVFASSDNQREFWLGDKAASQEELEAGYNGLKPCLHGSDAHDLDKVGKPDNDRYCWIKGAPTFDALHQAAISPRTRAFVGPRAPGGAGSNRVISKLEVSNADWLLTPAVDFNPGLVAIIGARGSGKTALADILARGCDAEIEPKDLSSFLIRATPLLGEATGEISWLSGETDDFALKPWKNDGGFKPLRRVRYLSQKFVEKLCSAEGMTDALLGEIEAIIFRAHDATTTENALDFAELRELCVQSLRQQRTVNIGLIESIATQMALEQEKKTSIARLTKEISDKEALVKAYEAERARHVVKGTEVQTNRIIELTGQIDKVKTQLRSIFTKNEAIDGLKTKVRSLRTSEAPDALRLLRDEFRLAALLDDDWKRFLINYTGDVDAALVAQQKQCEDLRQKLTGEALVAGDVNTALIPADADLSQQTLYRLRAEVQRLQSLINTDKDTALRFHQANEKVGKENGALGILKERLGDAQGAGARIVDLQVARDGAYQAIFETIVSEENVLRELYEPLLTRLEGATGTLGKLRFSVNRLVDVQAWADAGEEFIDLRRSGDLRGGGKLVEHANTLLRAAWTSGSAPDVVAAMAEFRAAYNVELMSHAPKADEDKTVLQAWLKRLAMWVYSTDHITLTYSLDYDGIDIRSLSPGTRGIVLLLLYLALDDTDDTPLIIDQPEENLDPKSIHDELVDLFIEARKRRQVIMVTHNANLVVNTDADQVIVASCGPREGSGLPPITYITGGLEEEHIRKMVCDTLEGGERAFQDRARRLRIKLQRA